MTGRIIEDDLFGVAARLKSIDDGYFVFLNYKTGRFEVHNSQNGANTLCLVLPYPTLDERTVRKVRYTRAERIRSVLESMERDNARRAAEQRARALGKITAALG